MKALFDLPEDFKAYATINYCYWRLREISKLMKGRKLSPIDMTVDKARGYDHYTEYYPEIKELLEAIIESKTFIEADSKEDKKTLEHWQKQNQLSGNSR